MSCAFLDSQRLGSIRVLMTRPPPAVDAAFLAEEPIHLRQARPSEETGTWNYL